MSRFKLLFDIDFSVDQKISSYLALMLIIALSVIVAWYTINIGQEISENGKNMPAFNVEKRMTK